MPTTDHVECFTWASRPCSQCQGRQSGTFAGGVNAARPPRTRWSWTIVGFVVRRPPTPLLQHLPSCLHIEAASICARSVWCLTLVGSGGRSTRKATEGCLPETFRVPQGPWEQMRDVGASLFQTTPLVAPKALILCLEPLSGWINETARSSVTPSMGVPPKPFARAESRTCAAW